VVRVHVRSLDSIIGSGMALDVTIITEVIWGGSFIVCLFFAVEILRSPRPEQSISAWILLFVLVPPAGALLYLTFGRRKLRRRAVRKRPPSFAGLEAKSPPIDLFDALIRSYGISPASEGNQVTFYGTGESARAKVIDLIESAQHSLWVSTYILSDDPIGRDIIKRLAARASAGVQVRLLVDYIGSPDARDETLVGPLRDAGGAIGHFMPLTIMPRSRHYSNLRNHRKIIVSDQCRAWSGGMNLSQLYLGDPSIKGFFHDLSFAIHGPAAVVYARIFASDWSFCTGEALPPVEPPFGIARAVGPGVVQVVPSGPEIEGDSVYDVMLTMAHRAERRLWVVSPYFVPDIGLLRALILAARRGVDVRFLTDFKSDVALIDFASIPYLRALANAGGRILRFQGGMLHAKALVMDDELAFAGTTNMDQRSLFLNFEAMALFHDPAVAETITHWMETFFDRCTSALPRATPLRQVAEGVVRLFAPVL
jgi:cardiolipin synthase